MKLAIHNWMREEPLETTLKRISSMGYSYIEIMGDPSRYTINEVNDLLEKYHIKCYGSVTLMLNNRNLLAKDENHRADSVRYIKDLVSMVADLGGEMVSVVPATVGKIVPDAKPEEEWEWAIESLKEIYEYSETRNVTIGIEPINRFETYFINRASQAMALAEAVGPNCGVCLDVFHMNMEEENPMQALRDSQSRLVNLHVADNNRFAPGMGTLDWKELVDTLNDIGYDKVLSVEFCPPIDRTPANPFPNAIDHNPIGLSPENLKYLEDHGSSALTEEFYTYLTRTSAETLLPLL